MEYSDFSKPVLTEPGVKSFLNHTLKNCNIIRTNFHNTIFNVGLLIGFMIVLGSILFYKYKGRLTPVEKEKKEKEKQNYILSKMKQLQEAKRIAHQELITGLPEWDNEYEMVHNKHKLY
jgi:uncharacterized membrane protein YciS (DUF1049 family)